MNFGLTGKAAREKSIIHTNQVEKEFEFSSDIDNLLGLPKIDDYVVFAFREDNSKSSPLMGVCQLINYKGEYTFGSSNIREIDYFRNFLGSCLNNL